MNFQTINDIINDWLEKQLYSPGDEFEDLSLKIRFFLFLAPAIPLLTFTAMVLWSLTLYKLAIGMFIFTIIELIITIFFYNLHRNTNMFALINQCYYLLFSFVGVLYFGGILYSGGVVFIGLAGALNSLYFLKPIQIRYIFIIYIVSIIIEAILQPFLNPVPEITPTVNLVLFVLHLLIVSLVFYSRLNDYIQVLIETKKKEADHLKELNKIKTNFYTNISHEFRTPLTVIIGLTDPESKISKTNSKTNFQMIRRNGIRLLQLVNQMLDLSKLEAQTMKVNFVQLDIITYLHQFIEPFKYIANEKKIELHFQPEVKEFQMDFDPEKMDSLIGNLLMNAIKYSSENSKITFILSKINGHHIPDNMGYSIFPDKKFTSEHLLKLEIKDNGIGIAKEEIPLIFNRFYRIGSNNHLTNEGAGIGLLLVKEIVNLLKGNLFIASKPGEGTQISILLPVTNMAAKTESPSFSTKITPEEIKPAEFKFPLKSRKKLPYLLLIEDNDDVVTYLKTIIGNYYHLERASNGIQGIEMALKNIPDIIVSDVLMPGKNGYEVCSTLKKDFRTSHIPIILLTAKTDKSSHIEGFEQGADAYITKPFNPRELLVRLQKLIEIRDRLKAKYKTLAIVSDSQHEYAPGPDEQFLIKTKQILEKYFDDDDFNAIELSNHLGMSRSQLFRKIKALTGLSASHFICFYRISIAKEKIQKTNLNISEIAYEVGFKDPAYFTRVFKREFGISPKVMRQNATSIPRSH